MNASGVCCEDETMENSIYEVESELDGRTSSLPKKRPREDNEDSESEWITVSRDSKRQQRGHQVSAKPQVTVTHPDKLPKQFALAKILRNNKIDGITRVKYINPFKILMDFESELNADRFINHEEFKKLGWRIQRTWEVGVSYGLVSNIELDISNDELLDNITAEVPIASIKRLNRREKNGSWVPCEKVRIGFVGSRLPPYIFLHHLRIRVEPFVFLVTQCQICWRYGHLQRMCSSNRKRCPKCTGNHENCDTTTFKCRNCNGNHMSLSKTCPVYIKEKKIRQLMAEFNCSYHKALTLYVPPSPLPRPTNEVSQNKGISEEPSLFQTPSSICNSKNITSEAKSTENANANKPVTEPGRKKKKNRRSRKKIIFRGSDNEEQEMEWSVSDSDSEGSVHSEKNEDNIANTSGKDDGVFEWKLHLRRLLQRLKDIILSNVKDESWMIKINKGFKCVIQWVKDVFKDVITKIPVIKDLKLLCSSYGSLFS